MGPKWYSKHYSLQSPSDSGAIKRATVDAHEQ